MNNKKIWIPGEEAYFYMKNLNWKDNAPTKVTIIDSSEGGGYFVTWDKTNKDAWFRVGEDQLYTEEQILSLVPPMYFPLEKCPFCGGEAKLEKLGWPHHVYCTKCGARVTGQGYDTEGELDAIKKWNMRYKI